MTIQYPVPSGAGGTAELTVAPLAERFGVRAAGEVGLATRGIWERALEEVVRDGRAVCHLELAAVTFVDVAGAGVLVDAARRLPAGRRIVVHRPPPALCRTLELFWPDLSAIEVAMS
ncbi:STAS domain-containing protein [Streptomyces sp. TRM72054]|uniref:STAS domain-containing protein n=1 Tax=Streptomyces sp. TRM72054 TaxID=2870562 RepID=UPI001C8B646E|nr:STAS domain-containing protein [Streptomyces sp. TRM72054]MBX9395307.1 STAS domain-containing protein [Streptomyces sp. TRM72054]